MSVAAFQSLLTMLASVWLQASYRQLGAVLERLLGGPDGVGVQGEAADQRHTQEAAPRPHPSPAGWSLTDG